ncbi:MAG: phosphatidate cytidylyltransferase [Candidatus Zixiibacteriota bacterium]|nr:MAG: phosphatidate cytidylyltransferase [candidate division Zixibacteria bacterium]
MPSQHPLRSRLLVALWGIPLIIGLIYLGGIAFSGFVALIAGIALFEFYAMAETRGMAPQSSPAVLLAVPAVFAAALLPAGGWLALMFVLAVILVFIEIRFGERQAFRDVPVTIFGWGYIPLLLGMLVFVRGAVFETGDPAWLYTLYFLSSIWICDTAAYTGGRALGRHRMAPYVSPRKTWEGAFFGLAGALLWAALWIPLLAEHTSARDLFYVALVVGTAGQLGDLVESYFKRSAGVKDSGTLLPEHGGALDRFDSLILSVPFVFFYQVWAGRITLF